ncbi:unnamed protein product [Bursaphelenchus okinawaensis]|uniref:Tyrosine-protein kinase n=1 Tax=Bursaphelenchus okinawaensis TaxID=465554 RepID=A0A811LQV5_9BILA|nr:unnamed protein product [Bursaphelenchus okinawaensis]CAG9127441.1 unnamed protein product [Bursaphelenchus okinawaensis]
MSKTSRTKNVTSTKTRQDLDKEDWYHGMLPREDIATLLKDNGQFLVRLTEPKQGQGMRLVLSCRWNTRLFHLIINEADGHFYIEHFKFQSVSELVKHYQKTKKPVTVKSGAVLEKPVIRQDWELKHDQIELGKMLGEGAFGGVYMGNFTTGGKVIKVAVKVHKGKELSKEMIKEMCKEARIMRRYDHPNIVKFYGVAMHNEPLMLVMELVDSGSLDKYLQKNAAKLTTPIRVKMVLDAAKGLEYLHDKGCIHRDVAARNCLVSEGRVKISDFGLSKEASVQNTKYKLTNLKQKLPIRWLAPETLTLLQYSSKSDVFSFGILMWEVFSDGQDPYPGMTLAEVNMKVREGYRMPPPESMPCALGDIMHKGCFPAEPDERMSMMQIRKLVEEQTETSGKNSKSRYDKDKDKDKDKEKEADKEKDKDGQDPGTVSRY